MTASGFFDLPNREVKESGIIERAIRQMCRHPQHDPPSHLHIPADKGYRHVCPNCGSTQFLFSNRIY